MSFWSMRHRRSFLICLFSLCLSAVLLTTNATSTPLQVTQIQRSTSSSLVAPSPTPSLTLTQDVRKTILDNGLTVLTKEVHSAPVVTVQVWYKVGSRNEAPGVNGIAHQLEHMLFKGTKDRPIQFGRLFSALGSESNAFTSYDNTVYFGTVERDKLNAMLTLEADRMQNALIDPQELDKEKRVVISELQGYENNPAYRLSRAVMRAAFPNQAYGLPVGGTKADVEKFQTDWVRDYYHQYYSPDNATLVIVGDFQTEPTIAAVKETFGNVAKSSRQATRPANPTNNQPTLNNNQSSDRIVLREEGSATFLEEVYPLPAINHPDVPALDVMDYILTEGRNSRLYQALVESGMASGMSGGAANLISGGWYELSATAAPGQKLESIEQAIASELAKLQDKGITEEELNRAKAQLIATVLLSNRDITSQAMQLGSDQSISGDYRFTDRYPAGIQGVSAADVQRVARTCLTSTHRTVGFFEPTHLDGQGSTMTSSDNKTSESFNAGPPVDPAEVAKYLPPINSQSTAITQSLPEELSLVNGVHILLLPDRSTPTVTLSGYIRAGTEFDTQAKAGLASLTAQNVMNGTTTRNALEIAKALEERGASLDFGANREGVSVGGNSLATDLPILIESFADVVQNATFPSDQLELTRQQTLTALKVQLDTPAQVAIRTFQQNVYPDNHPFHAFPTADSVQRISREDLVKFYQEHYRPDTTVLTLVGDFDPQKVRSLLETQLSGWQAKGKPPALNYPQVQLPKTVVQLNPVLPGKTQSITLLGYKGIDRKDPRFYAALVLNQILGGDTLSSRLGTEIRDRQGLTYGIYSYFQAGQHPGPFLIQMQTAPEDSQKAIASTLALLKEIKEQGVTAAEVAAAKRSITSQYPVALANPDDLAQTILRNEVYGLSRSEIRDFISQMEGVTLEEVNQAAKELIHPDHLIVVTAGPAVAASR
ncbi:MAG TPA: pitrilysin family protein [Cyanophyceae cyanobacterium]